MKLKSRNKEAVIHKWVCQVAGCEKAVAHNSDGTSDGNFKCTEHTRAYYLKYWYKNKVA